MAYAVTVTGGGTSFYEGGGAGNRLQSFTVIRDAADAAVAVNFTSASLAIQGVGAGFASFADFGFGGGIPFIMAVGQLSATFTLTVAQDGLVEPDETFRFTTSASDGGPSVTAIFTILDGAEPAAPANLPDAGARDDAFTIFDNGAVSGSVFYNNGSGGDVATTTRLNVGALNGAAGAVGVPTLLPSGASVTLSATGALSYNPGSAFTYLPVGSSAVDSFTYTLDTGSTARVSVTVNGFDNNDVLRGAGPLAGGLLNDTYLIDNAATVITERAGEGSDTVLASVSYSIGEAEIEVLSTRTHSDTTTINLTGNFVSQTIIGNFGDNILNGGGGADTLIGLRGNDLYAIGDSRAVIVEAAGEGVDTVVTSVDYTLAAGVSVEVLSVQDRAGTQPLALRGNETAQTIVGNNGANVLDGGLGNDTLVGGGGADLFAFTTALAPTNVDSVVDFESIDKIGLRAGIFGLTSVTATNFTVASAATHGRSSDRVQSGDRTAILRCRRFGERRSYPVRDVRPGHRPGGGEFRRDLNANPRRDQRRRRPASTSAIPTTTIPTPLNTQVRWSIMKLDAGQRTQPMP